MHLIFIDDKNCEPCKKAFPVVEEFASEIGFKVDVVDARNVDDKIIEHIRFDHSIAVPAVCLADDGNIMKCAVGSPNSPDAYKEMLMEMVEDALPSVWS